MLNRLKQALQKAAVLFSRSQNTTIEQIEENLLRADVGVKYTELIIEQIKKKRGDLFEILKEELFTLLNLPAPVMDTEKPQIIMISGVNGSGKTTTVAKLAYLYSKNGKVILACGDTYRDAASEQLNVWAKRADVEIVASQKGQDAASVVYDTISKAYARAMDTVLVDTAGRLHTRTDLMAELKKIKRVIEKLKSGGPDLNLLTIDANLGQNSIQQARIFADEIGINGLILTKFDGTAKGGAIIPICNELKLPVLYLGVGEGIEDIVEFEPRKFIEALFS